MKGKVTLKELVGTKIIYALLLVGYYWMWARRDWHDYYTTIQNVVCAFTILFFAIQADRIRKYSKEEKDEMAVQNCFFMRRYIHRRKNGRLCACGNDIGIDCYTIYHILCDGQ